MSSMKQNVSHTVDNDVLEALRKMSSDYVRRATVGEIVGTSASQAAQDAIALQDTLHGHARPKKRPAPAQSSRPSTQPAQPRKPAPRPPQVDARETSPRAVSAPQQAQHPPQSNVPERLGSGHRPGSPALPAKGPRPPARRDSGPAVPRSPQQTQGAGLPELLRREPSDVIAKARRKSPVERDMLLTAARAALRTLHTGSFPTSVARPAGDRAHQIIIGIERLQLTVAPSRTGKASRKRKKTGAKGSKTELPAKMSPAVRKQLNDASNARARKLRTQESVEDERLLLRARNHIYRAYGAPLPAGQPDSNRRTH